MKEPKDILLTGTDGHPRAAELAGAESLVPEELPPLEAARLIRDLQRRQIELERENAELKETLRELRLKPGESVSAATLGAAGEKPLAEQLRETEAILTALMQASPLAIGIFDAGGRLVKFNSAAEIIFGWREEQVAASFVPPLAAPAETQALMAQVLQGESFAAAEISQACPDGRHVDLSCSAAPLLDPTGKIRGFVWLAEEITARKQSAGAIQTQAQVLANMAEGVMVTDQRGFIIYTNPAFEKIFGYEAGELLGRHSNILNAYAPEKNLVIVRQILKEMRHNGAWTGEFHNRKKDGSLFYTNAHISSLALNGERLYISVQEDITARRQAEMALARQKDLLQGIIDNIPVMLAVYNPETRNVCFNRAFRQVLGWTEADLIGADPMELLYPDAAYRQHVGEYLKSLEPGWRDFQVTAKDGSLVDSAWANIRQSDDTFIAIGVDIRDRKQAETILRQSNQRLDLLVATANQLLASKSPQEIINAICHQVLSFLDCDVFFNFLVDSENRQLHLNTYTGISPAQAERIEWINFGAGLCGFCAMEGNRVVVEDIQAGDNPRARLVKSYGIQAYTCHPLQVEGKILGTLSFGSRQRPRFTDEELALMNAVANQVAIALGRQRAEAALQESERRFRQVVESIPQLVWTCTPQGDCDFLSKQWLEFTGQPEETQLGYGWLEQVHPDDRERLMATWQRAVAGGSYFGTEFRIKRYDGTYHWFFTRADPWTDDQGRIVKWFGSNTDITERKRAEAALEESENRYRSLFQNNHAVMLLIDPETAAIVDANPAACGYYGYSDKDLKGKNINEINILPLDEVRSQMRRACTGEQKQFTFQHRLASGEVRTVELYSGPIIIQGKKLLYSIVHDITERQHLEAALKESEERLRFAAQAGRMFAFDWDPRTDKVQRSAESGDILGLSGEVQKDTGQGYLAKVHPEDRDKLVKMISDLRPRQDRYTLTYRIVRGSDQKVVVLEEHARAFFDADGQMTRLYGMSLDVTARQRAVEALRESEERYRRLVEWSPDAILVHQDERYIFANQAAVSLFGAASAADLKGRKVFDLLHQDYHELVRTRIAQAYAGEATTWQEMKILRLDGQPVEVEVTGVPFEYQGRIAVQVILRDITDRKKAAREITHLASFPQLNPNPVLEIDAAGVITYANEATQEILNNLNPGRSQLSFLPEDWDELQEIVQQNGKRVFSREVQLGERFFAETLVYLEPSNVWRIYASDITGRKRAEEALRQERDFSAALLNTLGALVVVLDREGRIVRFNKACEVSTGYTFAEVRGKLFFDIFLLPEEREGVRAVFQKLAAEAIPNHHENHWLSRQGGKNLISWSNTTLTDASGRVTHLIGTGIDITRQRRAEEALRRAHDELERRVTARTEQLRHTVDKLLQEIAERERAEARLKASEARFAAFMRHLPGSAIMRDRQGHFIFVNESWEKALGRSPGESLGKTVFDFWPPEVAQRLHEIDQEVFRQNRPLESMVELPIAGRKHTFLSHRFPIRNDAGEVEMVGTIGIDITERLKAEEARDRLIEILEATPDFIGSADRESRLFYLNRAAKEMLGLTVADDISGLTFKNTHPAWAVDLVLTEGRPVYAQKGSWRGETAILRRDGTEIPVSQVILAHRNPEGRIKFFSTICRDISERKRAEEKLRKSEEELRFLTTQLLTAQEDERKRLAAELHDELGHALLTLKLQLNAVERALLPEQADLRERMRQIVAYLTDTVEELRRLYHALSPGDLEDLGLTTALRNMLEDFRDLYPDIEWHVDLADLSQSFPLPIQTMVYRIVQEALTNIGKHAYPGRVNIKVTRDSQQAVFVIEDDGRGFALDEVLDGDTGKRGMGLAAMAQRVSLAGGFFDLWSQQDQGVRIAFSIPCSPAGENG